MYDHTIIKKTGQGWKMILSCTLEVIGGVLLVVSITNLGNSQHAMAGLLFGMLMVVIGFIYECLGISCPNCKMRWVWFSKSNESSGNWILWLSSLASCPECGEAGNERTI